MYMVLGRFLVKDLHAGSAVVMILLRGSAFSET